MFNTRKYNYVGGGLLPSLGMAARPTLKASMNPRFTAPSYVDYRPLCIESSNQGPEPSCAGYAQAGCVEVRYWRETGEMRQFDGDECYRVAKTLDGMPSVEGTSLVAAAQAAEQLGWIKPSGLRTFFTPEEFRFALHKSGAVPIGLMITDEWQQVNIRTGYIDRRKHPKQIGGHAVLACYYDKDSVGFQNSWGSGTASGGADERRAVADGSGAWGVSGFGRMTWAQFEKQFMYGLFIEKPWMGWRR